MCPTSHPTIGWGVNKGKCCSGNQTGCNSGMVQYKKPPPKVGDWVCPTSHPVWGWGAYAGKCCTGNQTGCTTGAVQYKPPPPKEGDWICPTTLSTWGTGANKGKCCTSNQTGCTASAVQYKAPAVYWGCPADNPYWGSGAQNGKCCQGNNSNCVPVQRFAKGGIPLYKQFTTESGVKNNVHGKVLSQFPMASLDMDGCRAACENDGRCTHFFQYGSGGQQYCAIKDGTDKWSGEARDFHTYPIVTGGDLLPVQSNLSGKTFEGKKLEWGNTHFHVDRKNRVLTCKNWGGGNCGKDADTRKGCKASGGIGGILKWLPWVGAAIQTGGKAACTALNPDSPTDAAGKVLDAIS